MVWRMMKYLPDALFVSHGGGPLPLLGDPGHAQMVELLKELAQAMPRPRAVVVVSAHWEAPVPTLTAAAQPQLLYDYQGFPPASYAIRYPCPGEPALALTLGQRLAGQGLGSHLDAERGLDHGVFVPLKHMYPQADIPCVEVSLLDGLDAAAHLVLGRALAGLAREGVLLIGSGFSFHNLRAFFQPAGSDTQALNAAFEAWLEDSLCSPYHDHAARRERLLHWESAPGARYCHPRAEHLMPLHVCAGAAGLVRARRYALKVMGRQASMYMWSSVEA